MKDHKFHITTLVFSKFPKYLIKGFSNFGLKAFIVSKDRIGGSENL